jgi:hypothetical protein
MTERGVFFLVVLVSGLLVSSDSSLRVPFFPKKEKITGSNTPAAASSSSSSQQVQRVIGVGSRS